ncbi:hypothetical protein BH11PLA2_BH11PLA2_17580 [soil metagenome]
MPFWHSLVPGLKQLLCVRNPLEVALSLHRRGSCSFAFALKLWQTYTEQILTTTTPATRVVTHNGALCEDAGAEMERLLAALGYAVSAEAVEPCRAACKNELRHTRFSLRHLRELGLPLLFSMLI